MSIAKGRPGRLVSGIAVLGLLLPALLGAAQKQPVLRARTALTVPASALERPAPIGRGEDTGPSVAERAPALLV